MQLPTLDETDEFVNVLYYGDPGSGKTTGAMHMAKLGHVIAIDAEAGIKKRPLRQLGVPTANIHPYRIQSYADLDALYWEVKEQLEAEPGSIAGVSFDSMTEIQKKLIESIVGERHAKAVKLAQRSGATVADDEFAVDRDEYGKMTEMVRRICRRFRDLPCHTAFVCLSKRDVDNDGVFYRPALTPAFQGDLMGYVDVVAYTDTGDGDEDDHSRFVGITRPVGKFRGKDRFGATPSVMPNPTFDRILKYVEDESGEFAATDPYMAAMRKRLGQGEAVEAPEAAVPAQG